MVYGPNHWLRPAWEPFNGFVPQVGSNGGPPSVNNFNAGGMGPGNGVGPGPGNGLPGSPLFPTHPYARSPRDYFMID